MTLRSAPSNVNDVHLLRGSTKNDLSGHILYFGVIQEPILNTYI
jgi:hypothetical protein